MMSPGRNPKEKSSRKVYDVNSFINATCNVGKLITFFYLFRSLCNTIDSLKMNYVMFHLLSLSKRFLFQTFNELHYSFIVTF